MRWFSSRAKLKFGTKYLDTVLNQYRNASFFDQCYIVDNCKGFPIEWLIYLSLHQKDQKVVSNENYFFIDNKPCKNEFRELLLHTLGHQAHNRLRMIIDNRFYDESWQYYNTPTTTMRYNCSATLKDCFRYYKILKNPNIYYQIRFTFYEIFESFDNFFKFPYT